MTISPAHLAASVLQERITVLASYSEQPDLLVRRCLTAAMGAANAFLATWMRQAGMTVRQDAAANLIARYEATTPGAPALILGSHLDTVQDAGRYDGPLGILVALACVERLHHRKQRLPFALEVIAFADEEGLRFHTAYLGSSAVAGAFDPAWLTLQDSDGITLAQALQDFGGNPRALAGARRQPTDLLGYCEVHIEQGPVLEAHNLPLGIVSAIAGQSRHTITFTGTAGHAGTVPMDLRHDALCAAAQFILAAEHQARATPGLLVTAGTLTVAPGASNVIPGQATLSLDIRHHQDAHRQSAVAALHEQAQAIATARGIALSWQTVQENDAVPCSPFLGDMLGHALQAAGHPPLSLVSGAGHDAVPMSTVTPVAMLFVRCRGGISHHPAESVQTEDIATAIEVISLFLQYLATAPASPYSATPPAYPAIYHPAQIHGLVGDVPGQTDVVKGPPA